MNRNLKTICLHGILIFTLALSLPAAGQSSDRTPDPSQTDIAQPTSHIDEVAVAKLDALMSCATPATNLLGFVKQPAMEFMMGPGECAYDVVCAETCNATHFSCLFGCPGVTGSPQWLACSDVCRAQAIACVEDCCL